MIQRSLLRILYLLHLLGMLIVLIQGCTADSLRSGSRTPQLSPSGSATYQKPSPFQFAAIHYTYADVYDQPDIHAERLTQCVYGDVIRIEEEESWWYRVKVGPYPELEGWMHKAALTVLSPKSLYMQERGIATIVIRNDLSRIFIWPSSTIDIVMGTELPFIGESGQWYLVRLPSNDIGRIARDAVNPSIAEQPLIQSKQDALQIASLAMHEQRRSIVDTAQGFLGIVYVWGGTTPRGFDCSGLSYLVYKLNGIELPRVSWLQFRDSAGTKIKKAQLKQGDLVFFETYKKGASHVGIYIGDNQFIHASPSKGVTISDLNEPYFRIHYVGSKTILSSSS